MTSAAGKARAAGRPHDPDRIALFKTLFSALREYVPADRTGGRRPPEENANLSFFETYSSNFIDGTRFAVQEAVEIVFHRAVPADRLDDAHVVLGTFLLVSNQTEMSSRPADKGKFESLIQARHAVFMANGPLRAPARSRRNPTRSVPDSSSCQSWSPAPWNAATTF